MLSIYKPFINKYYLKPSFLTKYSQHILPWYKISFSFFIMYNFQVSEIVWLITKTGERALGRVIDPSTVDLPISVKKSRRAYSILVTFLPSETD